MPPYNLLILAFKPIKKHVPYDHVSFQSRLEKSWYGKIAVKCHAGCGQAMNFHKLWNLARVLGTEKKIHAKEMPRKLVSKSLVRKNGFKV